MAKEKDNNALIERQYVQLHGEIMQYGNMAMSCFVEFTKRLKEMRDGKYYLSAGIETFGEYVERQVGIKQRQAYNYISVYENYSEEFLQLNAKIGVTKLALLAPLAEDEREKILEEVDVENTSVTKLKEELAERDKTIKRLQDDYDSLESSAVQDLDEIMAQRDELADKLAQANDEHEKLAKAISEQNKLQSEKARVDDELKKAKRALEELRNAPAKIEKVVETVQVDNPDTAKALDEANKRIEQLMAEQQALTKKLELANDETMSKFKSKFEDLQFIGQDILNLISTMDETKASRCKAALKAVVGGWNL